MNAYKNYQYARDSAWKILRDCKADRLPVDVLQVCKELDIRVLSYEDGKTIIERHKFQRFTKRTDGFTLVLYEQPIIFYNSACTKERIRFTIAHELGHIVLGHVEWNRPTIINREPSAHDNPRETAANQFAARLLAPACVLWALDVHKAEDIAQLCDISLPAALFRAQRMAELYRRQRFLTSPLEQEVYAQFKPFINQEV
ncbi:MAG: ImmA/IrrE family metallo-endopeptidase [Clostridia bacterium]|nr:ImmA/IrrE family metallo-endopeptidase [Clostridia bacterium]